MGVSSRRAALNRIGLVDPDEPPVEPPVDPGVRLAVLQPFASSSIWNTPLGVDAVTKSAGLKQTGLNLSTWDGRLYPVIDPIHLGMDTRHPLRTVSNINQAGGGSANPNWLIPAGTQVHVPPGMAHDGKWNGICAFIRPGGKTYMEGQTLFLTADGNPRWAYTNPRTTDAKLDGDGRPGMHGGASLSGLGGCVRRWEWDAYATKPLRHVLSMNLFGKRFLSRGVGPEGGAGYRWPAYRPDTGFNDSTDGNYYALTDPTMPMMGSLLALPPTFDIMTEITHPRARWLATALQDFGAYVVDNTAWDVHAFSMEASVGPLFRAEGNVSGSSFYTDMMKVIIALHHVLDQGTQKVGGAGARRVTPVGPPSF